MYEVIPLLLNDPSVLVVFAAIDKNRSIACSELHLTGSESFDHLQKTIRAEAAAFAALNQSMPKHLAVIDANKPGKYKVRYGDYQAKQKTIRAGNAAFAGLNQTTNPAPIHAPHQADS